MGCINHLKKLTGLECNTILHILEHGEEGWAYAYSNYCEFCQARATCNILKGKVEILDGDECFPVDDLFEEKGRVKTKP